MSGYNLVMRIHNLEERCLDLGVVMCHSRIDFNQQFGDVVAVKPRDADSLPLYSRDAELFIGSLDALENWLTGIEWARKYDSMLFGGNHDQRRNRKEQDYRNNRMLQQIRTGRDDGKSKTDSAA